MEAIQGEEDGLDDPRERDSRRHEVEELPSPCGPSPAGRGTDLASDYLPLLTPLPPGEGPGVRMNLSSVALAIISRPPVVTHSSPSH